MSDFDKFTKNITKKLKESRTERATKLVEFAPQSTRSPVEIVHALTAKFGKIVRIGGPKRIYDVTTSKSGGLYVIDKTGHAFILAWDKNHPAMGVTTIFAWKNFRLDSAPDFMLQLPEIGDFAEMSNMVAKWIVNPKSGKLGELDLTESKINEMATRVSPEDFISIVKQADPSGYRNISIVDLQKIANDADVQIPVAIRQNPQYKINSMHYDLGAGEGPANNDDAKKMASALGGDVEDAGTDAQQDPDFQDLATLASAKKLKKMAGNGSNKVYLMGRKTNGAFFRIEGMEDILGQIERGIENRLKDKRADGKSNMEAQYDELEQKVKLVAGGESSFIKSLLVTGAPSSGKTYIIMKTIKALGLQEGKDYVVKKGRITTPAMYRTLIERVDGLIIFDDCDSVVEDKNAVNMLKGALDTDPVREISYDVKGTINTATMTPIARDGLIDAMSRILRNVPEQGDLEALDFLTKKSGGSGRRKKDSEDDFSDDFEDEETIDVDNETTGEYDAAAIHTAQQAIIQHLPNKIDFKGRIVFISNMDESDWDSAILTRSFCMNMNFTSGEMLDYIDKIKGNIKTPNLSDEQKQEVIDYLRDLYRQGKIRRQINFRIFQQACDIRLTSAWKYILEKSL